MLYENAGDYYGGEVDDMRSEDRELEKIQAPPQYVNISKVDSINYFTHTGGAASASGSRRGVN